MLAVGRSILVLALCAGLLVAAPSASATPTAPEAPWGLVAVPVFGPNGTTVLLSWQEPNDGGSPIIEFRIYRSPDGTLENASYVGASEETAFEDLVDIEGVAPVELVTYFVTAVNDVGEGQHSQGATAAVLGMGDCVFFQINPDEPSVDFGVSPLCLLPTPLEGFARLVHLPQTPLAPLARAILDLG